MFHFSLKKLETFRIKSSSSPCWLIWPQSRPNSQTNTNTNTMLSNQLKLNFQIKHEIPIKNPDLFPFPNQTTNLKRSRSTSISIDCRFKLRYPSLCLASLNPIPTPPIIEPIEMALMTRRLGMATVALIAVATVAFVASPADAAKEKRALIRSTVKAHDIVIFSKSYCPYVSLSLTLARVYTQLSDMNSGSWFWLLFKFVIRVHFDVLMSSILIIVYCLVV